MSSFKIMTAMYTLRKGGAYDRFLMMLEAFLERNCEIHCISLTPIRIANPLFKNHTVYLPLVRNRPIFARISVLLLFPFYAFCVGYRQKVDVFVAFGSLYAFIQGFSKWLLRKPMVTLIRGSLIFGSKVQNSSKLFLYLSRNIEDIGLHFSDRIITSNVVALEEISDRVGKANNIEIQLLYNNIPSINKPELEDILKTRSKYRIPPDAKVLVTAGIINRGKNIEYLIQCLQRIESKNIYALVVGEASTKADLRYAESLQRLARTLKVDTRVIFTGWLDKNDLWKIFFASDVFVLPSFHEGMPNALLEALGVGLPCLGSNIAGIKDILQYEELMFDPQCEKSLVDKIQQLFTDWDFLAKVTSLCQARKDLFVFDWKEEIFEKVISVVDNHISLQVDS